MTIENGKMGVVMAFYNIDEASETCIRGTKMGAGVSISTLIVTV